MFPIFSLLGHEKIKGLLATEENLGFRCLILGVIKHDCYSPRKCLRTPQLSYLLNHRRTRTYTQKHVLHLRIFLLVCMWSKSHRLHTTQRSARRIDIKAVREDSLGNEPL